MLENNPFLVSADWLENNLRQPDVRIIDASWYLPGSLRDPEAEYRQAHIPGAVFLEMDLLSDKTSLLPHALPTADAFADYAGKMGIARQDRIIVYDGDGFFSAPRIWWLFRIMGASRVYVLNGGFKGWKKESRPVTSAVTSVRPASFYADFDKNAVVLLDEMRTLAGRAGIQIADARGSKRFMGEEAEPRPGIKSGHMPGARNVPAMSLSDQGYLKTAGEIRSVFVSAGIDPDRPVITS